VAVLAAQEDVQTAVSDTARIYTTISATLDMLIENLLELRLINETRGLKTSGKEWSKRMSAIDSGMAVVASQVLAINSLNRGSNGARSSPVATELQGSMRQMRQAHIALGRASDTHSIRTAIVHLAAILKVMSETMDAATRCCPQQERQPQPGQTFASE